MSLESKVTKVKGYGDEIKQITDFVEQVRQTPDVYIGKVHGNTAFLTMVREIFQNSIDEILKGNAFSPNVYVTYDERNHVVTNTDNGRGIPFGKIGIVFGSSHTSSNYNKQAYCYSAGKNGCGASVTNALSNKFIVDSYQLGAGKHVEFVEGHIWDKGEVDVPVPKDAQGTTISFKPNETVIGNITSTWKDVYNLLSMIVPSAPLGTKVFYKSFDINGIERNDIIENTNGILTYLMGMTQNPMVEPIRITNDNGTMKMDMVFTYDASSEEEVVSLNNTCPTDGGTHVDGAIDGVCKFFRNYMNKIFLNNSKGKKITCTSNDVRVGLKLAISTFHLYALYNGQAKEILDNEDMIQFVSDTVQLGLAEWSKTNPNDLQKICKYIKDVIEIRLKADKEKIKLSTKFNSSAISGGLPDKYIKPNGNRGLEFIIVEGDSAFGSARNVRDANTQGILPIRGKILNAFVKSRADVLKNAEVAAILTILDDGGYGSSFDLSKCKFDKVIIDADADPDGGHIRTLLLILFALYCRPLVEAGRLYAAVPPLYAIPEKKGYRYFTEKIDFVRFVQNRFSKEYQVCDHNGHIMNHKDVLAILYNNSDYKKDLESVSTNHAIDPLLMETIVKYRKLPFNKFAKVIKSHYRFMEVYNDNGVIMLKGLANEKSHEVYISDSLFEEARYVVNNIDASPEYFIVNGEKCTLYQLMCAFDKFTPNRLLRFKGLGEMDPDMLAISTLRPDGDRLLIQYTFEDIEREIQEMRYINSNKNLLLEGLDNDDDEE